MERVERPSSRPEIRRDPRWFARVYWHRAYASLHSPGFWAQTGLVVGFWVAVGWPVYQASLRRGVLHTALALLLVFGRAWRQAAPRGMRIVSVNYLERKLGLYRLIREMRRGPPRSALERRRFQADALALIASYVRSHRADAHGTQIYVNLLVPEGDDFVVLARNEDHRRPAARYRRAGMLANFCFEDGVPRFTGFASGEFPSPSRKPYESILCIPVMSDRGVVGVVTIDSVRRHHFDLEAEELVRHLLPYVALVGWTLEPAAGIVAARGFGP